jgi:glycerate kinase
MAYVLLAPDKFKGSLTAAEVARHVAVGLSRACPQVDIRSFPVADGGDGTLNAAISSGFRPVPVRVAGPTGHRVRTAFAERDGVAVIELAAACGLRLLPGGQRSPMHASSFGAGQVIRAALNYGCREIVLGLGGSASTDGGAGLVSALGVRLLDGLGIELPPGGDALRRVHRIDLGALHPRIRGTRFVLASDVDNPLLGPHGAAAVYGPQKGATGQNVNALEAGLGRWASVVEGQLDVHVADAAGAGAAGGVGFAALAFLEAESQPGIELLLDLLGFEAMLEQAALVVTGEGSLDAQSLRGKAPVGVAAAAKRAGVPTVAVAGQVRISQEELSAAGIQRAYALTDLEPSVTRSITQAPGLLEKIGAMVAAEWLDAAGQPRARAAVRNGSG